MTSPEAEQLSGAIDRLTEITTELKLNEVITNTVLARLEATVNKLEGNTTEQNGLLHKLAGAVEEISRRENRANVEQHQNNDMSSKSVNTGLIVLLVSFIIAWALREFLLN